MNAYQTLLPAGSHWSLVMRSGTALTLTDIEGGANVGMLFYNPENLLERYNAPDTLKCQHTFRLTAGHCLYSDMGRIFCGIEEDSFGWHESVCGTLNAAPETISRHAICVIKTATTVSSSSWRNTASARVIWPLASTCLQGCAPMITVRCNWNSRVRRVHRCDCALPWIRW